MTMPTPFPKTPTRRWAALTVVTDNDRLILEEKRKSHKSRQIADIAMTLTATALLIGAYFILLPVWAHHAGASLAALCISTGCALFAISMRGRSLQVRLDRTAKALWLCTLNAQGNARSKTRLPFASIQSLYVRRPAGSGHSAALMARVNGKSDPIVILRGPVADIEAARDTLRTALRSQAVKPVRVQLAARRQRKPMTAQQRAA